MNGNYPSELDNSYSQKSNEALLNYDFKPIIKTTSKFLSKKQELNIYKIYNKDKNQNYITFNLNNIKKLKEKIQQDQTKKKYESKKDNDNISSCCILF